jgi:hypothetical protein
MDAWRGHLPITSRMLRRILNKAAAGKSQFSCAERILYTTCEFWAAAAARSIVTHLGSEVVDNLEDAIFAFSRIGAGHVENTLIAFLRDLDTPPTKPRYLERLTALEEDLLKTKDPVDHLIARFAEDLQEGIAVYPAWRSSAPVTEQTQPTD